jgi:hypothetical protein
MLPRRYIRGRLNMNHNQNRRLLIIDDNHSIHDDFRKILMPEIVNRGALDATEAALFGGQKNSSETTVSRSTPRSKARRDWPTSRRA